MPSAKKILLREKYESILSKNPEFILTQNLGLTMLNLIELRLELSKKGAVYKVIKNNILSLAINSLKDLNDLSILRKSLVGPVGIVLVTKDFPAVAKVLKDYSKKNEKLQILSGVMSAGIYNKSDIEVIANLPSKEEVLSQLAAGLNAPATQIASMMSQVMSSLARGIKAIAEKQS